MDSNKMDSNVSKNLDIINLETLDKTYWSPSDSDRKHVNKTEYSCELDKIARNYNADKGQYHEMSNRFKNAIGLGWPDSKKIIQPGHNYIALYEKYIGHLRNASFNLLEIGMGNYPTNGYSMRMWLDYFPNASIDVVDIIPGNFRCDFEYDKSRVVFHTIDQSNPNTLSAFCKKSAKKYDVIIDDGSHIPSHQILTFNTFFEQILNDGGIYVIEDLFENTNLNDPQDNIILHLAQHACNLQSNCLIDPFREQGNRNILDIASIHFYRSIIFIMKNSDKITK
jgi:hypothetical protein